MTEISLAQRAEGSTSQPAPAPARRRRRRLRLAAAAATLAAAGAAAFVAVSTTGGPAGHGPAAFAMERLSSGSVDIHVVRTDVAAKEMTRQLHDAGYDITVKTVPATPQLVGRWLILSNSHDVPTRLSDDIAQQALGKPYDLELPAGFAGSLTLYVGRATEPGETPQVGGAPNALAPGGLLHCARLSGAAPSRAATALARAGYTVRWADFARRPLDAPPAGARVAAAYIYDFNPIDSSELIAHPTDVTVVVGQPRDPRYRVNLWSGYAPSQVQTGQRDYSGC